MKLHREDNVVHVLRRTQHVSQGGIHICGYCFTAIMAGERYMCNVYVSNRRVTQHKVHIGCYYPNPLVKP